MNILILLILSVYYIYQVSKTLFNVNSWIFYALEYHFDCFMPQNEIQLIISKYVFFNLSVKKLHLSRTETKKKYIPLILQKNARFLVRFLRKQGKYLMTSQIGKFRFCIRVARSKKIKKAKFGHKQFQKRPIPEK